MGLSFAARPDGRRVYRPQPVATSSFVTRCRYCWRCQCDRHVVHDASPARLSALLVRVVSVILLWLTLKLGTEVKGHGAGFVRGQ